MANFLLITLPFLLPNVRFYPASYVYSIIKNAGWNCKYIDFNQLIYEASSKKHRQYWIKQGSGDLSCNETFEKEFQFAGEFMRDKLTHELSLASYDLIGVSLYSSCRSFANQFLRVTREAGIQAPVIFGGSDCFPSHHNTKYLTDSCRTPDMVFTGEGEISLSDFLKEFEQTRSKTTSIAGFAYEDDFGNVVSNPPPVPPNMEKLSIIADYNAYTDPAVYPNKVMNTFTSRGCVIKCKFCNEWICTWPYRRRNPKLVVDEIIDIKKNLPNSNKLWMLDSNINITDKHVRDISDAILNADLNIEWRSMACIRTKMSDDTLSLMKRSGCAELMLGLESASQTVVDYMHKLFDINEAVTTIEKYQKHGIKLRMPVMNGFPGEFVNDFLTTSAFILSYVEKGSDTVTFSYSNTCGIFEETEIHKHPEDFFIETTYSDVSPNSYRISGGANIPVVRTIRMLLNMHCIGGSSPKARGNSNFDILESLMSQNLNNLDAAAELAQIIYQLGRLTKCNEDAEFLLNRKDIDPCASDIEEKSMGRIAFLQNIIPGLCLKNWLISDKSSDKFKGILKKFIFKKYHLLAQILKPTKDIDFKDYRNKLYHLGDYELQDGSITELHLDKFQHTVGDNGKFLIIRGWTASADLKITTSKVLAITKENIVEFHCGVHSQEGAKMYGFSGSEFSGFLGKVKKSYINDNKIKILAIYNNKKAMVYELNIT